MADNPDKVIKSVRQYNPSGNTTVVADQYVFSANAKDITLKKDSVFNNLQDELNFFEAYVKHVGPQVVTNINGNYPGADGSVASGLSADYYEGMLYGGPYSDSTKKGWKIHNYQEDTDSDILLDRYKTLLENYHCTKYGYQFKQAYTSVDEANLSKYALGAVLDDDEYEAFVTLLANNDPTADPSDYVNSWGKCYELNAKGTKLTETEMMADISDADSFLYFYWNIPEHANPSLIFDEDTGEIDDESLQDTRNGQQQIYGYILQNLNPESVESIDLPSSTPDTEDADGNDLLDDSDSLNDNADNGVDDNVSGVSANGDNAEIVSSADADSSEVASIESLFGDYEEEDLYDILAHFEEMIAKYQNALNEYRYYSQTITIPAVSVSSTPVIDVDGTFSSVAKDGSEYSLCYYDSELKTRVKLEDNYSHGLIKSNSQYLAKIFSDWQKVVQGTCTNHTITFICYDFPTYDIPLKMLLTSNETSQKNGSIDNNYSGECFLIQRDFQAANQTEVLYPSTKAISYDFGSFLVYGRTALSAAAYYKSFIPETEVDNTDTETSFFWRYLVYDSTKHRYYSLKPGLKLYFRPTVTDTSTIPSITDSSVDNKYLIAKLSAIEDSSNTKPYYEFQYVADESANSGAIDAILVKDTAYIPTSTTGFTLDQFLFSSQIFYSGADGDLTATTSLNGYLMSMSYTYDPILYDQSMIDTYNIYGDNLADVTLTTEASKTTISVDGTKGSMVFNDSQSPHYSATTPTLDKMYHIVSSSCPCVQFLKYDSSTSVAQSIDWHLRCVQNCFIYFLGEGAVDMFLVGGGGGGGGGSAQVLNSKTKKYSIVKNTCGGGGGGGGGQCLNVSDVPVIPATPRRQKHIVNGSITYSFSKGSDVASTSGANLLKITIGAGGTGGAVGTAGTQGGTTSIECWQYYPKQNLYDKFSSASKTGFLSLLCDGFSNGEVGATDWYDIRAYNTDTKDSTMMTPLIYTAVGGLGGSGKPNGKSYGNGASGAGIGSAGGNGSVYLYSIPSVGGVRGGNSGASTSAGKIGKSKKITTIISARSGRNDSQYNYYPFSDPGYLWYFASGGAGGSNSNKKGYTTVAAAQGYISSNSPVASGLTIKQIDLRGGHGSAYNRSYENSYELTYTSKKTWMTAINAIDYVINRDNPVVKNLIYTSTYWIYAGAPSQTKYPCMNIAKKSGKWYLQMSNGDTGVRTINTVDSLNTYLRTTNTTSSGTTYYSLNPSAVFAGTGYKSWGTAKPNSGSGGAGGACGFFGTNKSAYTSKTAKKPASLTQLEIKGNNGQVGGRGCDGGSGIVMLRSSLS